ncbi:MAG: C40 family peptidase [Actinomycetota bacterium]|nr:C40 family peptidase [Actinomycetota bacterium]
MSGPALAAGHAATSRTGRRVVAALFAFFAAVLCAPLLAVMANSGAKGAAPSASAERGIPPLFLVAYQRAAATAGLDWTILAAIGKLECDHGRSLLPGCNRVGSVNPAGASGPMQFLATTWRVNATPGTSPSPGPPTTRDAQGYASDGDGDGLADIWNISDAALAAARLLRANGAPLDYQHALYADNHSTAYVARVLRVAETYRADKSVVASDGSPGTWALTYLGTPYVWGGNHTTPDSQLGAGQPAPALARDGRLGFFDCSSLVSWAYAKTRGLWVGGTTGEQWQIASEAPGAQRGYGSPPDGWQSGDLGFYDALGHVVLALNSRTFVEAPQTGFNVRIGLFSERGQAYGYARYPATPPTSERTQ